MFRTIIIFIAAISFSSLAIADGHGHHRRHHGHHHYRPHHSHHHHGHYRDFGYRAYAPRWRSYYNAPPVQYYPAPPVVYAPVAPRPPVHYYDRRTSNGFVGGAVGGAMGYHLGGGDPLAAGIGAAAGSWIGNGMR